jgi:transposase
MCNGPQAFVTVRSCGGASTGTGSADRCGSSPNGLLAADRRKREAQSLRQIPSARTIARLLTIGRDTLSKSETVTVAAIEEQVPLLVEAREIIAAFNDMIRRKSQPNLDLWLDRARASLVASFANGVIKDKAAVGAAIDLPWSNGQT